MRRITVFDGESGVEYALLGVYDLIILDVMLPKIDGIRAAEIIREKHCSAPILMLTAKSEVDDKVAGLTAAA